MQPSIPDFAGFICLDVLQLDDTLRTVFVSIDHIEAVCDWHGKGVVTMDGPDQPNGDRPHYQTLETAESIIHRIAFARGMREVNGTYTPDPPNPVFHPKS